MTFDPNKVYGDVPQSFSHRVEYALRHCEKEETKPMKRKSVVAILITVLCLSMTTTAVAAVAILSGVEEFFGWFYGDDYLKGLENKTTFAAGQSTTLNDVAFTLNDMIATEQTVQSGSEDGETFTEEERLLFFGTGVISVAEGENVVLVPRDPFEEITVDSPAGYALLYGNEFPAPAEDALTYAELAKSKDACLRLADCIPNGILDENGEFYPAACAYNLIPQQDGTLFFSVEIWPEVNIPVQESYQLSLYIRTEDVDLDGNPIEGTRRSEDWIVTLIPEKAE